jgi:PPM family protein phosphatase
MSRGNVITTIAAITDQGLVRTNNEDSFIVALSETGEPLPAHGSLVHPVEELNLIAVVSDGMGGTEGGEVASALTVETIRKTFPRLARRLSPQSRLEAAVEEANRIVWQERRNHATLKSMGATATAVLIEEEAAYIAVVGDSRAYVMRDGRIKQLTKDQTFVQALVDVGALTNEQAETHHHRNIILQVIGGQEFLQVAVTSIDLKAGDVLLLCSDGLSGKIRPEEMNSIVEAAPSLEEAAHSMVELAKQRGGEDNITAVLMQFDGNGLPKSEESLTTTIQIHSSFDPDQKAKPRRRVRLATFEDWAATAVIEHFAVTSEQREELWGLDDYGEYITLPKGDRLVSQGERDSEATFHYWLLSGRYRVEVDNDGHSQTVALLVAPTDLRTEEEIACGFGPVRVKRQFFTASLAMLSNQERNATIWCEDDENCAIKVSRELFDRVAKILGDRFLNMVKHS